LTILDDVIVSPDSSVCIETGYGLDARGSIPSRDKIFLQTGSEAHTTPYTMGNGCAFPGGKAAGD
jgi:hypothetical protein